MCSRNNVLQLKHRANFLILFIQIMPKTLYLVIRKIQEGSNLVLHLFGSAKRWYIRRGWWKSHPPRVGLIEVEMSWGWPWQLNSYLQAGIWFGSLALSPIITFPHFTMVYLSLPKNVVFSAHVHMSNTAYISFIKWNSFSGSDSW